MTTTVRKRVDNTDLLKKRLQTLTQREVLVGVPSTKSDRKGDSATNAELAYIHDNGSPANNIPPRPFMRPGMLEAMSQIQKQMRSTADAAMSGRDPEQGFSAVGMAAVAGIKQRIRSNIPPPLADSTIKARERRGASRTRTLIDTGQLLNSITYVVRKVRGS